MTQTTNPARARRGFTLVELLVVIGIIALLIAILMPALAGARKQAQNVQCLANLRTLGQAYLMYADAHKGTVLANYTASSTNGHHANDGSWFTLLAPYLTKATESNGTQRTTFVYYRCPIGTAYEKYGSQTAFAWDGLDYGLMDYSINNGTIVGWKKISTLRPAAQYAAFFDFNYQRPGLSSDAGAVFRNKFITCVTTANRYPQTYRHREGKQPSINAVFVDGHAGPVVTRAKLGVPPTSTVALEMYGDLRAGPKPNYQFTN